MRVKNGLIWGGRSVVAAFVVGLCYGIITTNQHLAPRRDPGGVPSASHTGASSWTPSLPAPIAEAPPADAPETSQTAAAAASTAPVAATLPTEPAQRSQPATMPAPPAPTAAPSVVTAQSLAEAPSSPSSSTATAPATPLAQTFQPSQDPAPTAPTATAPAAPPAPSMPAETGMSESDRRQVQEALRRLNYYRGQVDGDFGPATRVAIRRFQKDIGAEATGRLTAEEATRLVETH